MFASWVTHGAAILAVLGLGAKMLEGHDDESKKFGGQRPV